MENIVMLPMLKKRIYYPIHRNDCLGKNELVSFFSDGADYRIPAVNIKESQSSFDIEVAAPGLNKNDFKITVEKNTLTISSDKKIKENDENGNLMWKEFSFNSFKRSFIIPESVDCEKIKASHHNGILTIQLPIKDETKQILTREIMVS